MPEGKKFSTFADLIEGKTVAIVGPAEPVGYQGLEVESCDTIIRCNYRWNGGEPVAGYGERVDVVFYNSQATRNVAQNKELLESLPCVVLKHSAPPLAHSNVRHATPDPFEHANQVPIILNDIEPFNPAGVWVFGADFYTSGPEASAQATYRTNDTPEQSWKDLNTHNQQAQHEWVRAFQERTGLIKGDTRILEVLSISTDELMTRLQDAWREVADDS